MDAKYNSKSARHLLLWFMELSNRLFQTSFPALFPWFSYTQISVNMDAQTFTVSTASDTLNLYFFFEHVQFHGNWAKSAEPWVTVQSSRAATYLTFRWECFAHCSFQGQKWTLYQIHFRSRSILWSSVIVTWSWWTDSLMSQPLTQGTLKWWWPI